MILEWYMASLKSCAFVDFRPADPVHAKMAKRLSRRIPGHQIPKWRQDQHGVGFYTTTGRGPFCVTVLEAQVLPLNKGRLEGGQQRGIYCRQIRNVHQR